MHQKASVTGILTKYQSSYSPVVPFDVNGPEVGLFDFSGNNPLLNNTSLEDTRQFSELIDCMLEKNKIKYGIGGYLENRVIYRRSPLFSEQEAARSIHLGVDIWAPAGTPVFAPLEGVVHSFQDNARFGDYGPTIILEHILESSTFFTLYGHLSKNSLLNLTINQKVEKGQAFATLGHYPENGDWPPHLHFQLITDMLNRYGDFPGVCRPDETESMKKVCLNPNLILQSRHLAAF